MKMHIQHTTRYRYEQDVVRSTQYLRLTPNDSEHQKVLSWNLRLPAAATRSTDAYGNVLHVITVDYPHQDLEIQAEGYVEVNDNARELPDGISPLVFLRSTPLTRSDAAMLEFALPAAALVTTAPEKAARLLMERVRGHMQFQGGETEVTTPANEAFAKKLGVCQDFAHVFLALSRSIGLPARYVSGYLHTDNDDHIASHAWVEVWTDRYWWGLDIANGVEAGQQHLKLAVGMDYLEACPIRGVRTGGGQETLDAAARVQSMDQ